MTPEAEHCQPSPPEIEIRRQIALRGRITFAEFMRLALYHPEGGYYTGSAAFGDQGDYFTSPAAHPVFGALLAVQFHRMWEVMGAPSPFHVVEMGAGNGLLARDVLAYASGIPGFASSLRYVALDRYRPGGLPLAGSPLDRVITDGLPLRGVVGCIFSNELVDSFPVHRFQVQGGRIKEVYVGLGDGGGFVELLDEPSLTELSRYLDRVVGGRPDGFRGEVNLGVGPWLERLSGALRMGFVLTVDYGHEAGELYSLRRASGTLQTYYRHTQGSSPYQRVGRQDITAHVDFSRLISTGEATGLRPLGLASQTDFLSRLGHGRMVSLLRDRGLGQREARANLMGVLELVKADGLGAFKVLVQERGTGVESLASLAPAETPRAWGEVPLLRPDHSTLMEGRYPHQAWEFR